MKTFTLLLLTTALMAALILMLVGCQSGPPNTVLSTDDVAGRVIGALAGTPSERLASELGTAHAFTSGDELMTLLRAGTLDCVVMENSAAVELVARTPGVRILSGSLLEYDLRFAVARENTELLAAVNSALETLRQNGTLRGLSNKYFVGRSFTYSPPDGVVPRRGYLSLAVPPDSPPFSVMDADGEFSGLDIDVARAVCDVLGVELRIIEYDAWELVTAVWFGRADLALGWLPGEDQELVDISEAYANAVHVVIVRR
jgi:ABC-type amino acid transport substrate-binding protein